MSMMNLIESGVNGMTNSSNDGFKKEKIFREQYRDKKSYDMKIQDIKHDVNWSSDFFGFKKLYPF